MAAGTSPGGHTADENTGIPGHCLHAQAITQKRTPAGRAAGINRDDADGLACRSKQADQAADERALAHAGWTGDADFMGVASTLVQGCHEGGGPLGLVFNMTDCVGNSPDPAVYNPGDQGCYRGRIRLASGSTGGGFFSRFRIKGCHKFPEHRFKNRTRNSPGLV